MSTTLAQLRTAVLDAMRAALSDEIPVRKSDPLTDLRPDPADFMVGDIVHAWFIDEISASAVGNPGAESDISGFMQITGLLGVGKGTIVTLQDEAFAVLKQIQLDVKSLRDMDAIPGTTRLVGHRFALAHEYFIQARFFTLCP